MTRRAFTPLPFPESEVTAVHHAPGDYPGGKEGDVLTVEAFPSLGLNGGRFSATVRHPPSKSQPTIRKETDRYWNAIIGNGGKESQCGWCKDHWGLPGRSRLAR
jgi:predicted 3-demethylubiquinone-9 3-methyltransferase (glyoxalase superfamily)